MTYFTADKTPLLNFISDALTAGGFTESNSNIVAEHLVDAEMKGVPSHGVNRLGLYIGEAKNGIIDPCAVPELEQKTNNLISVDGAGGIGIVAMNKATEAGIKLARNSGIVAIAISNCGHTGRMGAYGEQAADAGFLGLSMGGGGRKLWGNVVPFGGKEPVMSTNPYTFSMPGLKNDPLVCDFAISNWPAGKVAVARANDDQLPPDIIIDKNGNMERSAGWISSGLKFRSRLVDPSMTSIKAISVDWLSGCSLLLKPSASKTYRVTQENDDIVWMLDTIASPIAEANGGYDAIRNQNGDYESIESITGKKLNEVTFADIVGLMDEGYTNIGRYDLTPEGLINVILANQLTSDTLFDQKGQDLVVLSRLRQKAQAANSYRTLKNRYRRLVNIPQEDQEQFLEMVGDLPTWLRLDTLLPEAAKELVRSTTLQE